MMIQIKRLFQGGWNRSIIGRLIITFLLIISPLYLLSLKVYQWAIQTQKEDISNSMMSQVNFYMENLEKEVQRIKLLQYYCTNDVNLQQLAFVPESLDIYGRDMSILQLQQHLKSVAGSSSYIKTVSVYIPSIDRVISASTFESFIPEEEYKALTNTYPDSSMDAQMIYWNNRLFLSVSNLSNTPIDEKNIEERKTAYIIAVELNPKVLGDDLKQFNTYYDGGAVLVDLRNRFVLMSRENGEVNSQMTSLAEKAVQIAPSGSENVRIKNRTYWTVYSKSAYLGVAISKYIPENEVLKPFRKYFNWFWVFTATALLLILLYSLSTYRMIYKPLSLLIKSFRRMERGDLDLSIRHKANDEFGYLYDSFNQMAFKLGHLIEQVYKQRILAQNAQLKQLQTQIVPHFLYNSYFILHRMVKDEDQENAVRFSLLLGNYLKFITRSGEDEVTLNQEVEHARIYTEIMGMRFDGRLKLEFGKLPEEFAAVRVPRLILQPIIENAFEHGLVNIASGGVLHVSFEKSDDALDIIVEDNGSHLGDRELESLRNALIERSNIEEIETTGILNIHRRLQYRFGIGSGLIVSRSGLGGLRVVVRMAFCVEKEWDHVSIADCG